MRIALVSDTFTPQVNGVTTVCRRIVQAVRDAGHAADVVAPAYPDWPSGAREDELRVPSLPFPPYPHIRLSLPFRRRVYDFLDRLQPDVIHVAVEGPLGIIGRRYAVQRGVPLVTSYHTNFPQYAADYGAGFLAPSVWRWLVRFHGAARLTQTPGEAVRDELVRRGVPRAVVWGRGVDAIQFHPNRHDAAYRRTLTGGQDTVVVLHVGRLAAEKNLAVLAEAWTQAHRALGRRATFVLAGEGPYLARLSMQIPFARRLGFLDRATLATLYASADVCVLTSFSETCGLVALEAMASGLPVIAANAGGLRESVRHGENGLLAPPHDAHAFAEAIIELVNDDERRRALGAAARRTALARSVVTENAELLAQYAEVAGLRPQEQAPWVA